MLLVPSTYVIVTTLLQLEQLLRDKSRVQAAPVKGPRWWAPLSRCCGYIWFSFSCCGSLLLSMVSRAQRHLVCARPSFEAKLAQQAPTSISLQLVASLGQDAESQPKH